MDLQAGPGGSPGPGFTGSWMDVYRPGLVLCWTLSGPQEAKLGAAQPLCIFLPSPCQLHKWSILLPISQMRTRGTARQGWNWKPGSRPRASAAEHMQGRPHPAGSRQEGPQKPNQGAAATFRESGSESSCWAWHFVPKVSFDGDPQSFCKPQVPPTTLPSCQQAIMSTEGLGHL